MFLDNAEHLPALLASHNTRVYQFLEEILIGLGEESVSGSAARHYSCGSIAQLPYPTNAINNHQELLKAACNTILPVLRNSAASSEVSWDFLPPS
jgi:hypothetical protein